MKTKLPALKTLLVLSLIHTHLVVAEDADVDTLFSLSLAELQQIKVSVASGSSEEIKNAPASVTVITEDQWLAMGATTLSDVLDTVPGILVYMSKAALGTNLYSIRGLQSDLNAQVLVLLNGKTLRSSTGGSTQFGFRKRLHDLKQIEIIRGPNSALYGADGYSGVINLVTKPALNATSSVGGHLGSFNTKQIWGNIASQKWGVSSLISASYTSTDDDENRRVNSDLQSILDEVFSTSASLAPGRIDQSYSAHEFNWQLEGTFWQAEFWRTAYKQKLGPGAGQAIDPKGFIDVSLSLGNLTLDTSSWLLENSELSLTYQREYFNSNYFIFPAGSVLPIGSDGNLDFESPTTVTLFTEGYRGNPGKVSKIAQVSFTHVYPVNDNHTLRWQLGGEYIEIDSFETKNFGPGVLNGTETVVDGTLTNVDDTDGLYTIDTYEHFGFLSIQDQWTLSDSIKATLGLRYDNFEAFGSELTPRFSIVWTPSSQATVKALYGSGYRAPTPNERYFRNNPVTIGNKNIKPEQIDSFELSLDYQWHENLVTNVTAFKYEAKDLIEYVLNTNTAENIAQNIGIQSGKGIELSIKWQVLQQFNFEANYMHLNANNTQNTIVPDVANKQGYLAINWSPANDWHFHFRQNHIMDRVRPASSTRPNIDDYVMSFAKIERRNIVEGLSISLIGKNIFNEDARSPSNGSIVEDFPLAGRQILMDVSYKF